MATIRRYSPGDLEQCRSLWTDHTDGERRREGEDFAGHRFRV